MKIVLSLRSLFLAIAAAMAAGAQAQADPAGGYPGRPVHVIVGFAAGAGTDLVARLVGQKLAEGMGQAVVVENKPGAAGIIGTEYVAKAKPDGYTLLMSPSSVITINPIMYRKLPYSVTQDFVPISTAVTFPLFLVVSAAEPIQSLEDLVRYIKAQPKKANYGGSSGLFQLSLELFKLRTGTQVVFVPYKGTHETVNAVLAGEVLMTISDAAATTAAMKSGKLRGLAVTTAKRAASFPDIPTMAEAGLDNLEVQGWMGLFAPAGTPMPTVKKLENEIARIVKLPDFKERMNALQISPSGNTSEEFARVIASDLARWREVAKAGNIEPGN